jgi:hypothetical protein
LIALQHHVAGEKMGQPDMGLKKLRMQKHCRRRRGQQRRFGSDSACVCKIHHQVLRLQLFKSQWG